MLRWERTIVQRHVQQSGRRFERHYFFCFLQRFEWCPERCRSTGQTYKWRIVHKYVLFFCCVVFLFSLFLPLLASCLLNTTHLIFWWKYFLFYIFFLFFIFFLKRHWQPSTIRVSKDLLSKISCLLHPHAQQISRSSNQSNQAKLKIWPPAVIQAKII